MRKLRYTQTFAQGLTTLAIAVCVTSCFACVAVHWHGIRPVGLSIAPIIVHDAKLAEEACIGPASPSSHGITTVLWFIAHVGLNHGSCAGCRKGHGSDNALRRCGTHRVSCTNCCARRRSMGQEDEEESQHLSVGQLVGCWSFLTLS